MGDSRVASRYQLGELLGKGGMGEVYRAVDLTTGRPVAVKLMRSDPYASPEKVREWEVRFEREVQAASGLRSPHVVPILDSGVDPETQARFLVMELLEGEDLSRVTRRLGPLPVEVALRIAIQICLGLAPAHAQGIVHRDIKPGNIFLGREGERRTARILDFGIARLGTGPEDADMTDLTRTGSMVGSPQYMSPEQARGAKAVDTRADIWSVGVVLYKMLSGTLPHDLGADGGLGELLISICFAPAPSLQKRAPWVPPAVAEIVHRALSIPREARYATAHELAEALLSQIPTGTYDVHETWLVGIGDAARAVVAPKAELSSASLTREFTGTDPVMEAPARPTRREAPLGVLVLLAAVIFVGAFSAALFMWKGRAHAEGPVATVAAAPLPVSSAPVQVTPPASSPPPGPAVLRASLGVPSGVTVEVDGVATPIEAGRVTLSGAPGTTRVVKIALGKQQKAESVVITADGEARPSSLAFPERKVAGGLAPSAKSVAPVAPVVAPVAPVAPTATVDSTTTGSRF